MPISKNLFAKKKKVSPPAPSQQVKAAAVPPLPYPSFVTRIDVSYFPPFTTSSSLSAGTIMNNPLSTKKFLIGTPIYGMMITMNFGAAFANGMVTSIKQTSPNGISETKTVSNALSSNGSLMFDIATVSGNNNNNGILFNVSNTPLGSLTFNVRKSTGTATTAFALNNLMLPLYPIITLATTIPQKTFGSKNLSIPLSFNTPTTDPASQTIVLFDVNENHPGGDPIVSSNRKFSYTKSISLYTPESINQYLAFAAGSDVEHLTRFYNAVFKIPCVGTVPTYVGTTTANINYYTDDLRLKHYSLYISFPLPSNIISFTSSANYLVDGNRSDITSPASSNVTRYMQMQENIALTSEPTTSLSGISIFTTSKGTFWGKWSYTIQ